MMLFNPHLVVVRLFNFLTGFLLRSPFIWRSTFEDARIADMKNRLTLLKDKENLVIEIEELKNEVTQLHRGRGLAASKDLGTRDEYKLEALLMKTEDLEQEAEELLSGNWELEIENTIENDFKHFHSTVEKLRNLKYELMSSFQTQNFRQ